MSDALTRIFDDFDRGRISRRTLLQMLGVGAVAATPFGRAVAQGSCGGANRGTPRCNTTPFPAPFAATGWKTVLVDHFSVHAADYGAEAAFFNALMGWKVRSDDGTKAVLDIGDWGGVVIRGGYQPPAPPQQVAAAPPPAAGDTAGGRGGRGGRGGGRGGGGRGPVRAVWDNFCVGIAPWDTKTVEAELKKRGLDPVADHAASADFYSFHVKDPDGFDFQVSNGNRRNRRTTPANGKLMTPPPFEPTGWKSMYLDHISWQCTSYKESVAFYQALVGWQPLGDEGSQNEVVFAPEIGGALIRGGNANMPGGLRAAAAGRGGRGGQPAAPVDTTAPIVRRTVFNHISFGIADFDPDKVKAALEARGLNAREDTGATAESPPEDHDIHTAHYKSYHTTTPNGWDLQISDKVKSGDR